jgi:anthranilate synthase component 2
MILLIDNYDSFSYNLYQLIGGFRQDIKVVRNDFMSVDEIEAISPERVVISPGPGHPRDAGVIEAVVSRLAGKLPILGVCLGHQAICEAFGATISSAKALMHGKASDIGLDTECPLFKGLPKSIKGARYHSLAAVENTLPKALAVTARAEDGEIMAVHLLGRHVYGLQFHPESILTPLGGAIIKNFLEAGAPLND